MTDVHQDESPRKPKKRGRVQKQAEQSPQSDVINYDDKAIAKGKRLAATVKSGDGAEMKLGELADRLQPKYGKNTLARFAKDIHISAARLARCRSIYRAYKDNETIKESSPKSGVLAALQGHPKRAEIIKEFPNLTVAKARIFMSDYRKAKGVQADWQVRDTRGWLGQAKKHADEAIQYGHPKQEHLDPNILRQAIDDWDILIAGLRLGGEALVRLADELKRVRPLALPEPPLLLPRPMFDDTAPSEAPQNEATPDNATSDEAAQTDAPADETTPDNTTPVDKSDNKDTPDNATPDQAT